uniref:Uncharacterized protein n=1 Tax=Sphingobacterium sp. (strain 21) TaxID=743722 RepID=F4C4E6_SPHS2
MKIAIGSVLFYCFWLHNDIARFYIAKLHITFIFSMFDKLFRIFSIIAVDLCLVV